MGGEGLGGDRSWLEEVNGEKGKTYVILTTIQIFFKKKNILFNHSTNIIKCLLCGKSCARL